MAWQTPKVNWSASDGVRDTDMNRIEGNILDLENSKTDQEEFIALRRNVENALFDLADKTAVGDLIGGTEFGLYENGLLVPFIKLMDNYNGSGRVLVVRKDVLKMDTLFNTSDQYYGNSKQDNWLDDTYPTLLESSVSSAITTIGVVTNTAVGVGNLNCKVFLLSLSEYGQSSIYGVVAEGSAIPYFNSASRRTAKHNGDIVPHWTRSVLSSANPRTAACINAAGDGSGPLQTATTYSAGIRPAFTLPATFEVVANIPNMSNVLADAEVL